MPVQFCMIAQLGQNRIPLGVLVSFMLNIDLFALVNDMHYTIVYIYRET